MQGQPGGPGTGMTQHEQYNRKEILAVVGSAGLTADAGNAEETPLSRGKREHTDIRSVFKAPFFFFFANQTWISKEKIQLPSWLLV